MGNKFIEELDRLHKESLAETRKNAGKERRLWNIVLPQKSIAVNDHICPSCKNDRVSKSETSCWKCGGKL